MFLRISPHRPGGAGVGGGAYHALRAERGEGSEGAYELLTV
jgi:hypothetical protein